MVESEIGETVTKCNKSQNMIVTKSTVALYFSHFRLILQHIIKPIVDWVKVAIEGRKKKRRQKSVREKKPAGTDGEDDGEVV